MQVQGPNGESHIRTDPASQRPGSGPLHSVRASDDSKETSASIRRTKSGEIGRLRGLVEEMPEIREALVREIATRLNSGEYETRGAARRTAESLMDML